MIAAICRDAAAVAAVITKALKQDDTTPAEELLSPRVLLEMSLPLLKHLADNQEPQEAGRSPDAKDGTVPLT